MFNDILTGKATLEEKPASGGPYREPEVPDVTLPCATCKRPFTTKANSGATRCTQCHLASVQAYTPMANLSANLQPDNGARVIRVMLGIGLAIGVAIFRTGMRHSYDEDMRSSRGYSSYDTYQSTDRSVEIVIEADRLADRMCECRDATCGAEVESAYNAWADRHRSDRVDDASFTTLTNTIARYEDCSQRLAR